MSIITLAIGVALASLLLPYASHLRPQVEQWLSQRIGQPVEIEQVSGAWAGPGPSLTLHGVIIDTAGGDIMLDSAEVGFDLLNWVRPGTGGTHFRLLSDRLELVRKPDGSWGVAGLVTGQSQSADDSRGWLQSLRNFGLRAGEVVVSDEISNTSARYGDLELTLNNAGGYQEIQGILGGRADTGGSLEFRLRTRSSLSDDPTPAADFYLEARELDLPTWLGTTPIAGALLEAGQLTASLWGHWDGDRLESLQSEFELDQLTLAGQVQRDDAPVDTRFSAQRLAGYLELALDADGGWQFNFSDGEVVFQERAWGDAEIALSHRPGNAGDRYAVTANTLNLGDISSAVTVVRGLPEDLRDRLYQLAPQGEVSGLDLRVDAGDNLAMRGGAALQGISWRPVGKLPGVSGLTGSVQLQGAGGSFQVDDLQDTIVELPKVFRWPLLLNDVDGTVGFSWDGPEWTVDAPALEFRNEGVRGLSRVYLRGGDGRPFIDAQLRVYSGQVEEARRFWPYRKFNQPLIDWLDRALVRGSVEGGNMVLYGDLDQWPFRGGEGKFEARAIVEDALVDFHPDWPAADQLDASLYFDAQGLSATLPRASLANLPVNDVEIDLPQYREPRLKVAAQGQSEASRFLAFLRRTPIYQDYREFLEDLSVDGAAQAWTTLELPLRQGMPEQKVVGHVWLDDALVTDEKWGIEFPGTTGRVDFSDKGISGRGLDTNLRGYPSRLSLATGEFVSTPGLAAEAVLVGVAPASIFTQDFPVLEPVLSRVPEACEWTVRLTVEEDAADGQGPRMTLESDLLTSQVDLPPPLNKPPGAALPVKFGFDLPDLADLTIQIGDVVSLDLNTGTSNEWSGLLLFGGGRPYKTSGSGLAVGGQIPSIDLDQWSDFMSQFVPSDLSETDTRSLQDLDVKVDRVRYSGRDFTNLNIKTDRDTEYWTVQLDGDQIKGQLRIPVNPSVSRLLLAEFERLEVPESDVEMESSTIDPRQIPPLRFVAQSLKFGATEFGEVSFESYPTGDGMHIDQLETRSEVMAISATGDWNITDQGRDSQFGVTVSAEDLGDLLDGFGFTRLVEDGQTILRIDAHWPGGPTDFDLANLGGELDVRIIRGRILEVEPGAGRIFGLLSLQALPRRLQLDFGDLFRSGLSFDSIEGKFNLDEGDARTDNLLIKGPTADILIKGRTGVAAQDYDQVITVVPEVGSTLPLVGALAGGGAGAAAAFVLQNIFDRAIDEITQFHYSVTGSWDEPVVELIGADDQRFDLETAGR